MPPLPLYSAEVEKQQAQRSVRHRWLRPLSTSVQRPKGLILTLVIALAFVVIFWNLGPPSAPVAIFRPPGFVDHSPHLHEVEDDGWDVDIAPPPATSKWTVKAEEVKGAFLHAYHDYEALAFGHDELRPTSNRSVDK